MQLTLPRICTFACEHLLVQFSYNIIKNFAQIGIARVAVFFEIIKCVECCIYTGCIFCRTGTKKTVSIDLNVNGTKINVIIFVTSHTTYFKVTVVLITISECASGLSDLVLLTKSITSFPLKRGGKRSANIMTKSALFNISLALSMNIKLSTLKLIGDLLKTPTGEDLIRQYTCDP